MPKNNTMLQNKYTKSNIPCNMIQIAENNENIKLIH